MDVLAPPFGNVTETGRGRPRPFFIHMNEIQSTLQQLPGKTIRSARLNLEAASSREHLEDIILEFTDGTSLEIVIEANADDPTNSEPLRTDVMLFLRETGSRR